MIISFRNRKYSFIFLCTSLAVSMVICLLIISRSRPVETVLADLGQPVPIDVSPQNKSENASPESGALQKHPETTGDEHQDTINVGEGSGPSGPEQAPDIAEEATGKLLVWVKDAGGEPLPQSEIRVVPPNAHMAFEYRKALCRITNNAGLAEFSGLPAELEFSVTAHRKGYAPSLLSGLNLNRIPPEGITISLNAGIHLHGTLMLAPDTALSGYLAKLSNLDSPIEFDSITDENGFVSFKNVMPGNYYLLAYRRPVDDTTYSRRVQVNSFPEDQAFGIIIFQTGSLLGSFSFPNDSPPSRVSDIDVRLMLSEIGCTVAKSRLDPTGKFKFDEIPSGEYEVLLSYRFFTIAEDSGWRVSISGNSSSEFSGRFPRTTALEVIVTEATSRDPVNMVDVLVIREAPADSNWNTIQDFTGLDKNDGKVVFPFLPPGTYTLVAEPKVRKIPGYCVSRDIILDGLEAEKTIELKIDFR